MNPEKIKSIKEQIAIDCLKEDTNCLYDATELNQLVAEMQREHSVTKTQLEKAEKLIAMVRYFGLDAIYRAIESINKDTHREKDHSLKQVLMVLRFLVEATYEDLKKVHDLDDIPW